MLNWTEQGQLMLQELQNERRFNNKNGIYHYTQIVMTYHSNRIEGSRLSEDHTRSLFETKTVLPNGNEVIYSDDVVEAMNHFAAFNYMLDHANEELSEEFIKKIQGLLTVGTEESREPYFNVGDYKSVPNMIGSTIETTAPEDVPLAMEKLLHQYHQIEHTTIDDIIDFHVAFERIHPFQNGNGRTGRLIAFKECLKANITPFIITNEMKPFYLRGLTEYSREKGYLRDTCLLGQDHYIVMAKKLVEPKLKLSSK